MTQNPIQTIVETVDFASTMQDIMLLTLQNKWEILSFRISNNLQI